MWHKEDILTWRRHYGRNACVRCSRCDKVRRYALGIRDYIETEFRPQVSHLFQVQLTDTHLAPEQIERLGAALRSAATHELLKMDFRMDEITPLFRAALEAGSCGGACSSCHS